MLEHARRDIRANEAIHDKRHRHEAAHKPAPAHRRDVRDDDLREQLQARVADRVQHDARRDRVDVVRGRDDDVPEHVEAQHDEVARRARGHVRELRDHGLAHGDDHTLRDLREELGLV